MEIYIRETVINENNEQEIVTKDESTIYFIELLDILKSMSTNQTEVKIIINGNEISDRVLLFNKEPNRRIRIAFMTSINDFAEIPYSNVKFINDKDDISIKVMNNMFDVYNFDKMEITLKIFKGMLEPRNDNVYRIKVKNEIMF